MKDFIENIYTNILLIMVFTMVVYILMIIAFTVTVLFLGAFAGILFSQEGVLFIQNIANTIKNLIPLEYLGWTTLLVVIYKLKAIKNYLKIK